jgi:hypothetical protein
MSGLLVHPHPDRRTRFFFPSTPKGAALIASTTAPSPQSAFLSPRSSFPVAVVRSIFSVEGVGGAGAAPTINALRATLHPSAPSNSASISSSSTRLRFFLRSFPPGATGPTVLLLVVTGAVGAAEEVTPADAEANSTEGVACRLRHSSGLRCSKDKPSPRVKNRAYCEPARRVA